MAQRPDGERELITGASNGVVSVFILFLIK
jgi:hypothetical protein